MRVANLLIAVGAGVLVVGIVMRFFPGLFSWFGNLPGDITRRGESTRVFIPITSMIIVSVIATIVLNVLVRLFRDS